MQSGIIRKIAMVLFILAVFSIGGCFNNSEPSINKESDFGIDSLEGQTIRLIVPYAPGGGYDTYARLMAPYIEKYTKAVVIVDNIEGAAGVVGRNEVYNAAPDGLTICFTAYSGIVMNEINEIEAAQYTIGDFNYLGRITGEPTVLVAGKLSNIMSVNDLIDRKVVKFGEPSAVDDTYFSAMVFAYDHGINFLPITGYEGTSALLLAIQRGEFDVLNRSLSVLIDLIEAEEIVPLVVNGYERSAILSDVPTMLELANTEVKKQHALLFAIMVENSRGFIAPPGLSDAMIETWQSIIALVANDQGFLEDTAKSGLPVDFLHGKEVSALLYDAIAIGEEMKPLIKEVAELSE